MLQRCVKMVLHLDDYPWCYNLSIPDHLGTVLCKHVSCNHSPQPEGSDTQQRHEGPRWEILVSYFYCQESTLITN